jgi:hypothetical protein
MLWKLNPSIRYLATENAFSGVATLLINAPTREIYDSLCHRGPKLPINITTFIEN